MFLEAPYPVDEVRLEIRFWRPATASHEYYWINWIEPTRDFLVGWHQDGTHSDLGKCHLQLDYRSETVTRESATFIDEYPLSVIEQHLTQLPSALNAVRWDDEIPTLTAWST